MWMEGPLLVLVAMPLLHVVGVGLQIGARLEVRKECQQAEDLFAGVAYGHEHG